MADAQSKRCTKCGEVKALHAFSLNRRNKTDGRVAQCKECWRKYSAEHHAKNRESRREYQKDYYIRNRDRVRARWERWRQRNPRQIGITATEKRCGICGEVKPASAFTPHAAGGGGLRADCKPCRAREAREWRERNPDAARAIHARWRKVNVLASRQKASRYAKANRDKVRRREREYRRANPDADWQKTARRRARRVAAPGAGIRQREKREILAESLGLCAYCNGRKRLTIDHVEPLARGGAHDKDNAAACCSTCNASKNDRSLLVWLALRANGALVA